MTQLKRWDGSSLEDPSQVHRFSNANGVEEGTFYRYNHAAGSVDQIWPAQPSDIPAPGLSAVAVNEGRIDVTITDQSRTERKWELYRSTSSGFTPGAGNHIVTITTSDMDGTGGTQVYQDTGLSDNQTYYYKARGVNRNVDGLVSSQEAATTPEAAPTTAPTDLTATKSSTSPTSEIDLEWTDNTDDEDHWNVHRSTSSGFTPGPSNLIDSVFTTDKAGTGSTETYQDSGLADDTTYYYKVVPANGGGTGPASNQANATTDLALPAAPSGMTITSVACNSFSYEFTDNADNEDGFNVYVRKQGDPWPGTPAETHGASAGTGGTVSGSTSGLDRGATYEAKATAQNSAGESGDSNTASDTLDDVPSTPTGETAEPSGSDQIDLSVDALADADDYKWYRSTSTGFTPGSGNLVGTTSTPSFTDTGLSQDTQYFYRCIAENSCGESGMSNEFTATTWPAAPKNIDAEQTDDPLPLCGSEDSHIQVTWDNGGRDTSQLTIQRDDNSSFSSPTTLDSSLAAGTEAYNDTISAGNEGTYYYRVKFNDETPEEWSATATATAECQL